MNGQSDEEAIANYTGRKCMAALYSKRLPHCVRNDIVFYFPSRPTPENAKKEEDNLS